MGDLHLRALRRTSKAASIAQAWMALGPLKTVKRLPSAPEGRCYLNVQQRCRRRGGAVVLGWWLCHEPGLLIGAFHHAIWQSPCGRLFDLDQTEPDDASQYVTFLPDPTPLTLASPAPIDDRQTLLALPRTPRFLPLSRRPDALRIIEQFSRQIEAEAAILSVEVYREYHDQVLGRGAWLRSLLS